jgi:NADPH:quinone reductase-like Zn-dependent oxidoreductase
MPLGKPLLDSVIDSAGGAIAQQVGRVQRQGGRIVIFGMTVAPQVPFTMREVLRNQRLIGQNKPGPPFPTVFNLLFQVRPWAQRRTFRPVTRCAISSFSCSSTDLQSSSPSHSRSTSSVIPPMGTVLSSSRVDVQQ